MPALPAELRDWQDLQLDVLGSGGTQQLTRLLHAETLERRVVDGEHVVALVQRATSESGVRQ